MSIPRIQGMRMGPTVQMAQLLQQQPQRSQAVEDEVMKATRGQIAQALRGDPRMGTADRMAAAAMDTSPVQSVTQGLARLLQGHASNKLRTEAEGEAEATANSQAAALGRAFGDNPQARALAQAGMYDAAASVATREPTAPMQTITDDEAMKLGLDPGGVYQVDPATQAIKTVQAPDKPDLPTGMVMGENGPEYLPAYLEGQTQIADARRPQTTVDMGPQQTQEQKDRGSMLVKRAGEVYDGAQTAQQLLTQIETAREINRSRPELADTSKMQAFAGNIGSWLGFSADQMDAMGLGDITGAQQFQGVLNNLVLSKLQAQKGPQTENDARRIEETVANLQQTPEARDFLLRSASALARRDVEKSRFVEDWYAEEGTYDGAFRAWDQGLGGAPITIRNPRNPEELVFYDEWLQGAKEANKNNPKVTEADLLEHWKQLGAK